MTYRYETMFDQLMKSGGKHAVDSCKIDIEYEQEINRHDQSFTQLEFENRRTDISIFAHGQWFQGTSV